MSSSAAWLASLRRLQQNRWAIGVALAATPAAAILQGAFLLQDFRQNHGDAPIPVSPSRGIVVMRNDDTTESSSSTSHRSDGTTTVATSSFPSFSSSSLHSNSNSNSSNNYQLKPLRLLVIGDSLAAGVGVSTQGTPILPESIAKSLSQASGGRAVRWTCVGTPGATASQIVHDILSFQDTTAPTLLEKKLVEWQTTKKRAQEWLEERKKQQQQKLENEAQVRKEKEQGAANKIERWWLRVRTDVTSFRKQVLLSRKDTEVQEIIQKRRRLSRRLSNAVDPDGDEYDIAIVLTGVNDLKDMVLPFMTTGANSGTSDDARRQGVSSDGLKGELMRVLQALKDKMKFQLPARQHDDDNGDDDVNDDNHRQVTTISSNDSSSSSNNNMTKRGPLVVFPSLPIAPLPFSHRAPLSWFAVPLLRGIDNHKRRLAERFPNFVLFVESPSSESVQDMEAGRGRIFDLKMTEQVLLRLTDVKERAREKVEELMKQHYQQWTNDKDAGAKKDEEPQQQDVYHVGCHDHLPAASDSTPAIGSTMVAADNVHPNDAGYDFWGRHIAAAIVAEWDKLEERQEQLMMQATSPAVVTKKTMTTRQSSSADS